MTAETCDPPEYSHPEPDVFTTPKHFLEPDPQDSTSCLRCGDVNGYGCLHLTEPPAFDDIDDGPPPICDRCPHFSHSSPCDVVVSRYPQRLCPCGGEQCVA